VGSCENGLQRRHVKFLVKNQIVPIKESDQLMVSIPRAKFFLSKCESQFLNTFEVADGL
jgi:hypothetical protein